VKLAEQDREPEPQVVAFLELGQEHIGRNGLDIGCGLGRHTLAALRMGYTMAAVDFARVAIRRTRQLILKEGFCAEVRCASMHDLPFRDSHFDFALSWCVWNHGTRQCFEKAISEAARVLRPDGAMLGLVMTQGDSRYGKGVQIEEDCFVFTEGPEEGVCHYFPTKERIIAELERYVAIEICEEIHFEGDENAFYHPQMKHSCYLHFITRKR
jgi:SAM-dependent methyltransferase